MTPTKWIERARRDEVKLLSLITHFYPGQASRYAPKLPITASLAQAATEAIAAQIAEQNMLDREPAVSRFKRMLADGLALEAFVLLQETWFGVPESTECWNIVGFRECVDLLDDPPEDES